MEPFGGGYALLCFVITLFAHCAFPPRTRAHLRISYRGKSTYP